MLPGTTVNLSATINDTRYNNSNGTEPTQAIAAAEYYVDTPPWVAGAAPIAMAASDGNFNASTEKRQRRDRHHILERWPAHPVRARQGCQ